MIKEERMKRFASLVRPPMRLTALLLAAVVGGCGSAGGDDPSQFTAAGAGTGVRGLGRGPAPVALKTAGFFALLAETAITDVAPSEVTGNVGLTSASGYSIGLTCAELAGLIYTISAAGPSGPCRITDASRLTTAKNDGMAAFFEARDNRAPDYVDLGGGNIGGRNLGPATYKWNTAVSIPTNLTLTGGPNDVWIFQIWQVDIVQSVSLGAGAQIILAGGALPQNVYWVINGADLGTSSKFKGVILADNAIVMGTGASLDGRMYAGSVANLDHNTVAWPTP